MAEPLKKPEISPDPAVPQPFPNQPLRAEDESLDSLEPAVPRVEGLGARVVPLRRPEQAQAVSSEAWEDVPENRFERVSELWQDAEQRVADLYDRSRRATIKTFERSQRRIRYWSQEHPLYVIAGAAAVGFIGGVLLRMWRSDHYEQ